MELSRGDKIKDGKIVRIIHSVGKSSYTWKYENGNRLYDSSNSSDPKFELGWKKVK